MSDYNALAARTQGYALQVKRLFDEAVKELLDISKSVKKLGENDMFTFDKTNAMKERAQRALRKLHAAVTAAIERGIDLEWKRADKAADGLITSLLGKKVLDDERYSTMLMRNDSAMRAFMHRADNGMNLSSKVWKSCEALQKEMEMAITVSIGEGESASTLARRVKQYLNEPDKLFRRVRDEKGNLKLSKAAAAYHPGQGVYRSSYKNAMRLARTETNMAYRNEDCRRVSQMDFVLGIRISLSNHHATKGKDGKDHKLKDICDELQGDYPKTFKWSGWHPQCRCHMTTILPSREEMKAYNKALLNGQSYSFSGKVTGYPANFTNWITNNKDKIEKASTLPYFIADNQTDVDRILGKEPTIEQIAAERHAARTPEQVEAIKQAWAERNHKRAVIKKGANNVVNVAKGWSEVDYSALQAAIDAGDYMKMQAASKAVAQSIVEMRAKENALIDLIPDVHDLHKQFTINQLESVHHAVQNKISQISMLPLDQQEKALQKEMMYVADANYLKPHTIYPTWKVAQDAYAAKIIEVKDTIFWNDMQKSYNEKASFVTKSQPYKDLVQQLADAIAAKDKFAANVALAHIEAKRKELDKKYAAAQAKKYSKLLVAGDFPSECFSDTRKNAAKWSIDADEADDYFQDNAVEFWKKGTEAEKDALYRYTEGSSYVTEPLRAIPGHYYAYGGKLATSDNDIKDMTTAIAKQQFAHDVWIKRDTDPWNIDYIFGVDLVNLNNNNLLDSLVGMVGLEDSFQSCGSCKNTYFGCKSVVLNIYCPAGVSAVYAQPFSNYGTFKRNWNGTDKDPSPYNGNENEIIMQRGAKLRITKAEYNATKGKYYIDVEVIGFNIRDFDMESTPSGYYCKFK